MMHTSGCEYSPCANASRVLTACSIRAPPPCSATSTWSASCGCCCRNTSFPASACSPNTTTKPPSSRMCLKRGITWGCRKTESVAWQERITTGSTDSREGKRELQDTQLSAGHCALQPRLYIVLLLQGLNGAHCPLGLGFSVMCQRWWVCDGSSVVFTVTIPQDLSPKSRTFLMWPSISTATVTLELLLLFRS